MKQDDTSPHRQPAAPESGARVVRPAHSKMVLSAEPGLRRLPRAPHRHRDETFWSRFEDRILFYDCFRLDADDRIALVGPPPFNLEPHHEAATFTALPSGQAVLHKRFVSRSTMLTVLEQVPDGTTDIKIGFAGQTSTLAVQPHFAEELAGAKLLFAMSKDNPLAWIECWARWHIQAHQIDTIVFFDNGSTTTHLDEIGLLLSALPGLKNLVLLDWPHKFGASDKAVVMHTYWAHFLQISAMNLVLRRFGARAQAILNCDVDELVAPVPNGSIYDRLAASENGIVRLAGTWVESAIDNNAVPPGARTHFDYRHVRRDFTRHLSPAKWLLDPRRSWVGGLDTFPYWHDVKFPPDGSKSGEGRFWHFKGINSNWKSPRQINRRPSRLLHVQPDDLAEARKFYQRSTTRHSQ